MDEYNRGMGPEVTRYFRKIINSFSYGMMWLIAMATAGLFFGLALPEGGVQWYNIVFYLLALATLFLLIRYLYRTWKK